MTKEGKYVGPGGSPVVRFVGSGECPERKRPSEYTGPHEPLMVNYNGKDVALIEFSMPERTVGEVGSSSVPPGTRRFVSFLCRHCGSVYTTIQDPQ